MPLANPVLRKVGTWFRLPCLALLLIGQFAFPRVAHAQQAASLFRDELQILYLVNLQRRAAGIPPLAWNAEMTESARWFARDAIETLGTSYCGHTDSQGRSSNQRIRDAGYIGSGTTAENAMCGYAAPADTVRWWMESPGHRANILNPRLREAGPGYYRNANGDGYAVLDFGYDRDYAPLVIDDEALTTSDPTVSLFLYDQDTGNGWSGAGPTVEMMIANTPDFAGAAWEPYTAEREWTLPGGEGWRTVFVKTRDRHGQMTIVHDAIYLGSRPPDDQLALEYATQVDSGFTLRGIPGGYTHVQYSLNWLADDGEENFQLLDGQGERINDPSAVGGSAFRLAGGSGTAFAWAWSSSPFGKVPAVAYFRLKLADLSAPGPAAVISVGDGQNEVAARTLTGSDFAAAGQYQEFALPFTPSAAGDGLIVLFVRRTGSSDLVWDGTGLYTPPVPLADPFTTQTPNRYYRSSGVQVRLVTPGVAGGATTAFSAPLLAYPHLGLVERGAGTPASVVQVNPSSLTLSTPSAGTAPEAAVVTLTCTGCGDVTWEASSNVPWLTVTIVDGQLRVAADPAGLARGMHGGTITLTVAGRADIAPVKVPVSLVIGDLTVLFPSNLFLPAITTR
jgi:uncharacterized protein YkwD